MLCRGEQTLWIKASHYMWDLSSLGIVRGTKTRVGWHKAPESFPVAALDPNSFVSYPTVWYWTRSFVWASKAQLYTLFTGDVQSVARTLHNSLTQMSLLDLNGSKFPRQMLFDRGFFFCFLPFTCWKWEFSVKRNLTASLPTHLKRQKEISIELWK